MAWSPNDPLERTGRTDVVRGDLTWGKEYLPLMAGMSGGGLGISLSLCPSLVISRHIMPCHIMSCHVGSCHVMSCYVMSCYFTVHIYKTVTSRLSHYAHTHTDTDSMTWPHLSLSKAIPRHRHAMARADSSKSSKLLARRGTR